MVESLSGRMGQAWFHWFREPIAQALLFSLAVHLASVMLIQPASSAAGRQTVVINAHLQMAIQTPEKNEEQAQLAPDSIPEVLPKPEAESISAPIVESRAHLMTALTPSPAPPIPLVEKPDVISPVESSRQPTVAEASPPTAEHPIAQPAEVTAPADPAAGPKQPSVLPSLPIAIDSNWYLARQVDQQPKAIGVIQPVYPELAKRRNQEGTLKLMLKIDHLGRVQSAEVVEAIPPGVFDEAALAAFRDARFQPAMKEGRPVRYQAYMRVDFKLND